MTARRCSSCSTPLFQIAAYSLLGYFYLTVFPGWLGLDTAGFEVGIWEVARTVLIFLGIPLAAGYLTRRIALERKGRAWYDERFLPRIGPITLYGLLFTIILLFAIQGDTITSQPLDVALIAVPLLVYFAGCGSPSSRSPTRRVSRTPHTASTAFIRASNDFELTSPPWGRTPAAPRPPGSPSSLVGLVRPAAHHRGAHLGLSPACYLRPFAFRKASAICFAGF